MALVFYTVAMNSHLLFFTLTVQNLLTTFEAFESAAYLCPANKLTIGYGHVLLPSDYTLFDGVSRNFLTSAITMCTRQRRVSDEVKRILWINKDQALQLLRHDVTIASEAVKSITRVPLSQNQFDALVSLVFNIGQGQYAASTLRKKLLNRDYAGAAVQFERWIYSDGKVLNGLKKRRANERKLFETPDA